MSEQGFIIVDRAVFDHPVLSGEPYSKVQAFLWLVSEAAWKPRKRLIGGKPFTLARGQLACSFRFLAKRWDWPLARVQRFLACLKIDTMIDTVSDTHGMIVTICNYDVYQPGTRSSDTPADTGPDTILIQTKYIKNFKKELMSEADAPDASAGNEEAKDPAPPKTKKRPVYPEAFEKFWLAYPTDDGMSKQQAYRAWEVLDEGDRATALASMSKFKVWIGKQGDGYRVVHCERFLKHRRFDGFAAAVAIAKAKAEGDRSGIPDDVWHRAVDYWQRSHGDWNLHRISQAPDHPQTKVPPLILAKLGVEPRSAAA